MIDDNVEYYNIIITKYQKPISDKYLDNVLYSVILRIDVACTMHTLTKNIKYNYIPRLKNFVKEVEKICNKITE